MWHSVHEITCLILTQNSQLYTQYCTISNCSAGGVTRDHLDEIFTPSKSVVTRDMAKYSAGQPPAAGGVLKIDVFFFDCDISSVSHFGCDPGQPTDFVHIHK